MPSDANGVPFNAACIARDTMDQQQWPAAIEELGQLAAVRDRPGGWRARRQAPDTGRRHCAIDG
jgi:hypothetical protein